MRLEAFTRVAFSTGAGWGLYLTYSVYAREREGMAGNAAMVVRVPVLPAAVVAVVGAPARRAAPGPMTGGRGDGRTRPRAPHPPPGSTGRTVAYPCHGGALSTESPENTSSARGRRRW